MARTPAAPVRVEVKSLSVQSELHSCFFVLLHRKCQRNTQNKPYHNRWVLSNLQGDQLIVIDSVRLRPMWLVLLWRLTQRFIRAVGHSPETSTVKVSLLTPTRLKATHSTVILRLDSPTVKTLSTSTAPYSSRCTSTVRAWGWFCFGSPVLFPLHLPHCNAHTSRRSSLAERLQTADLRSLSVSTHVGRIPEHWYQMIWGAGYPKEVQVSVVIFSHLTTAMGFSVSNNRKTVITAGKPKMLSTKRHLSASVANVSNALWW